MPQDPNSPEKRRSRAERRAAEAAAMKAQAEQSAKERKQQTLIGAIVLAIVAILIVIGAVSVYKATHSSSASDSVTVEQAYGQLQDVSVNPERADDQGGVLISKDGYGTSVDGAPTLAIYMDFLCPGCGSVHRSLDEGLIEMVQAGQLNVDLHFMSFMDRLSTDEYSSRAANAALYLADHDDDPMHLLTFVQKMYAEDFQPGEGSDYESVSDEQIKQQMLDAGVAQDVADAAFGRDYQDWLDAVNLYTPKRSELWNTSGSYKGSMTTPTLTINGTRWDLNEVAAADMTIYDGLLEAIGLSSDDVGNAEVMPSIGADGDPIPNMTGE